MKAIKVPAWFQDDGCSGALDWLPSCGNIRQCCRPHDWLYRMGGDESDRLYADQHLYDCIMEQAIKRGNEFRGRIVAHLYYFAVRAFGWRFYNYVGRRRLRWYNKAPLLVYGLFLGFLLRFGFRHLINKMAKADILKNDLSK